MSDETIALGVLGVGVCVVCLFALFFRFNHYLEEMKK